MERRSGRKIPVPPESTEESRKAKTFQPGTEPEPALRSFTTSRDPKVIRHAPTRKYVAVVYAGLPGYYAMYDSTNLLDWNWMNTVRLPCRMIECPDLFELPVRDAEGRPRGLRRKWVFMSNNACVVGDFDGTVFKPDPYFCLACLSMAAWTWMRYSYCWELFPSEMSLRNSHFVWPDRAYIRIGPTDVHGRLKRFAAQNTFFHKEPGASTAESWGITDDTPLHLQAPDEVECLRGRLVFFGFTDDERHVLDLSDAETHFLIDTTSHRLTGQSVAGLVVGAMGCFIFGLYLRRWLRKRRGAATPLG